MGVAIASILSVVPNAASHRGIQIQGASTISLLRSLKTSCLEENEYRTLVY